MTAVAHASPGPADSDAAPQMPDDPDLQLARDPRAGAGRLMVLAGNRPDLRGVIVDNPGCSPELRAWVSRMGGASAGPGGGGHSGPETAGARTDGSGGADDADDAVSLAPTGWEPSDIGLGEDPFGSVLGDPLMGSPLFDDDGGPGREPADAEATEPTGAAARNGKGGRRAPSSRRTARPHTASAHTAPARTTSRTAEARGSQAPVPPPQRPAVTMPAPPAPMPPGRFAPAAPYPVPGIAGPVGIAGPAGAALGQAGADPWALRGAPAVGLPSAPPPPSGLAGAPGASFGMGRYNAPASSRSARRPASSSRSSASPAKVIGWILFVLLFIVIRAFNG